MRTIPWEQGCLYLGNARDARDPHALYAHGIQAVVDLAGEERPADLPREFLLLRFPLADDDANDPVHLRLAVRAVADLLSGGLTTLVACGAGLSRSPAIAAFALADITGQAPDEWLLRLAAVGPADVSPGLWRSLLAATRETARSAGEQI